MLELLWPELLWPELLWPEFLWPEFRSAEGLMLIGAIHP
jgi:hypothetical protein